MKQPILQSHCYEQQINKSYFLRAQELAARMGFHQDPKFSPLINMFPEQIVTDIAAPQKPTKAPVLRLDAQGREIDEHGNVVNVTKPSNLAH
ncbi:hypothetical protein K1719_041671 [Acacia pycnantha]|nr:hypothetical protein K1719_041671 [Acacia pycnantha]